MATDTVTDGDKLHNELTSLRKRLKAASLTEIEEELIQRTRTAQALDQESYLHAQRLETARRRASDAEQIRREAEFCLLERFKQIAREGTEGTQ